MNPERKNLNLDAIAGLRFSTASKIFEIIAILIIVMILARLIEPKDFGIMAMCSVFTGISALLIDFGTSDAIIRHKEEKISDSFLSSIFWINNLLGIVIMSIMISVSGLIANLYGYEIIKTIVIILSINIIFSAMESVPTAIIIRNLDFRKILYQKVLILPISGFIGVTMAVNGYGVWSLVAQQIVFVIGGSLFIWYLSKWKPIFSFDVGHIKEIFHFSGYLSLSKFVNYFTKNGDLFLIGKYIGAESLGIYSKGYQFTVQIIKSINGIVIKVFYPSISKIQNDKKKLSEVFASTLQVMLSIYSVIFLIGFMFSEEIVYALLGGQWGSVAPLLPVFLLLALFFGLGSIGSHTLKALGHAKLIFKIIFFNAVLTISAFVIGLQWGIKGVAIGYLFTTFILFLSLLINSMRYLSIRLMGVAIVFFKNIILMLLVFIAVGELLDYSGIQTSLIRLILGMSLILIIVGAYHYTLKTLEFRILKSLIKNKLSEKYQ